MRSRTVNLLARGVLAFVLIAAAIWVSVLASHSDVVTGAVADFGYLGVFALAVVSGFNIVVPVPLVVFVPLFLSAGLALFPVVLVITLGMTVGDTVGYIIGAVGGRVAREHVPRGRVASYIVKLWEKHPVWPYVFMFLYAAFSPLPNEVAVIPLAFLGYRLRYLFPAVFLGNMLFNMLAALGVLQVSFVL